MDKKLLHLGLNLGPFTPNPHTLPSELSGTMKIFEGNDVYIQILNSDYLSTSPHFQKSDSVSHPWVLPPAKLTGTPGCANTVALAPTSQGAQMDLNTKSHSKQKSIKSLIFIPQGFQITIHENPPT